MLTEILVRNALKDVAQPHIFSRGERYYRSRLVVRWSRKDDEETGIITIAGSVRGIELYDTTLLFDPIAGEFSDLSCSCPYEDVCKHAVALGLKFAHSLKDSGDFQGIQTAWRNKMKDGSFDLLSTQLQQAQQEEIDHRGIRGGPARRGGLFDPSKYFISLNTYTYNPTFHERRAPYLTASVKKVLDNFSLSPAQSKLLTYIRQHGSGQFSVPPPDPAVLFPLLAESGIPVYHDYYISADRLKFNLHPDALSAELIHDPVALSSEPGQVRHDFFLRVFPRPKEYEPYWYANPFRIQHTSLVWHREGGIIELHPLSGLLAGIFSRIQPVYGRERRKGRPSAYFEAQLSGDDLERFDQLVEEASRVLQLTTPPPQLTSSPACKKPQPAIVVEYDHGAETLQVIPVIEYGKYRQSVVETVYRSSAGLRRRYRRRHVPLHPGTHIVTVESGTLWHARIDEKREIRLYKSLVERAEELGFTTTLRCRKQGGKKITAYLDSYWPRLAEYAREQGYPVFFTKDALPTEQMVFRADFTADVNTENDWLYFDVSCYCGDERITLEKLLAYIARGDRFWRTHDGKLVDIANREELERLVRLLQGFHARESGGFEGTLRYVSELEYVMTCSPHYNAVRAKSLEKFLSTVHSGKPVRPVRLSGPLASVVRPYQRAGIDWLYFLRSYHFGGVLADDMGLGKTLQTLAVLSMENTPGTPSIVVCPKTLLYNWKNESNRFVPALKVLVYDGTPGERGDAAETIADYDLIVVSYEIVNRDRAFFLHKSVRFNYAVLDEAQFIKNHATQKAQVVKQLNARYRLVLTGTPMENSVVELWSMFDFVMPGFLGNVGQFITRFQKPIMDSGDRKALEHLRRKVQPFMLRRTKQEVLSELPPKIEQISECHLSKEQSILYQQVLVKVRGEVFGAVQSKGFQGAQIHILAGLMKLRQVCNHPGLLVDGGDFRSYKSAKLDTCMELVDEVVESRRKVLIFSQFTGMLDIISATLNDRGVPHVYLSGKTKNRQVLIDSFNTDPALPVFLISLKAGGTGVNLTAAETVIIFDPWWNPAVEDQAIGRAHRIGQMKAVNVYRLLTFGTIEEKIQALKEKKQRLFDAVVGESGNLIKKLTWEDVRELFAE